MNPIADLAKAYRRLPKAPTFGYTTEKISFVIGLHKDGSVATLTDIRSGDGKKKEPRLLDVPAASNRSGKTPKAFFLWDNSAFVLGVSAPKKDGAVKDGATRLAAFKKRHEDALATETDEGLVALLTFIRNWQPDDFGKLGWPEAMLDGNIVFALESERLDEVFIHDRPAAKALWASMNEVTDAQKGLCVITGQRAPIARLHPVIKGVWGAQSSGAGIVSFNQDSFASYGHDQGENASISVETAFAYTTALNRFLQKDSKNRIQIGDASVVFWADASNRKVAADAEYIFARFNGPGDADDRKNDAADDGGESQEASKVREILDKVRRGAPIDTLTPDLPADVRFHVLALAPNASRLSIRFYIVDDFAQIAKNYLAHVARIDISPPDPGPPPSIWRLLPETAVQRKIDNIPPRLGGDWLYAILAGIQYPLSLMSLVLTRIRADHTVNARRAGILKSVLIRNFNMEVPMALDVANHDPGYLLGRLFATYEYLQVQALGGKVNATIRDQFYGTASATPRSVFPLLQRKATHHLSKLRKDKPGFAVNIDRDVGAIYEIAAPDAMFPATLNARHQAMFAVGYYHQRSEFYRSRKAEEARSEEA